MPYSIIIHLGGTGSKIGTAFGRIYPFLYSTIKGTVSQHLIEKDTESGSFKEFQETSEDYESFVRMFPFSTPKIYKYECESLQLMQKAAVTEEDYSIRSLLGTSDLAKILSDACWTEETQEKSLKDFGNIDLSAGSLDVYACMRFFEDSDLSKDIDHAVRMNGEENVRIVITSGLTGVTGGSWIIPIMNKIKKEYQEIQIDLVLLGPYFKASKADTYRTASARLQSISEHVTENQHIYYISCPAEDMIFGELEESDQKRRKSHGFELFAALACLDLKYHPPGFYETVLYDNNFIIWNDLPLWREFKKKVISLMRLISAAKTSLLPVLSEQSPYSKAYLSRYFRRTDDIEDILLKLRETLKEWILKADKLVEFWYEIEESTQLGRVNSHTPSCFFSLERLKVILTYQDYEHINDLKLWLLTDTKLRNPYADVLKFQDIISMLNRKPIASRDPVVQIQIMLKDIYKIIKI